MARIPYADPSQYDAATAKLIDRLAPLNLFKMLAHAPGLLRPFVDLGTAFLFEGKLDPVTREYVDRNRSCWGRDKMAMYIVTSCLKAARDLGRMRRVPGPNGEPKTFAKVMIGLPARFPRKR